MLFSFGYLINLPLGDNNANILYGSSGNDVLEGRGGADTLYGDAGFDIASWQSYPSAIYASIRESYANDGDSLNSIEGLIGSVYNDILVGSTGDNTFDGLAGNDYIVTGGGNDVVTLGPGNDVLIISYPQTTVDIKDFSILEDRIDLRMYRDIRDFSKLVITDDGVDSTITLICVLLLQKPTITIRNVKATQLSSSNFILGIFSVSS